MYLENQESVREKSVKSQGKTLFKVCGNPELFLKFHLQSAFHMILR